MKFASRAVEKVSKAFTKKLKHGRLIKKYDTSFDESTFGEIAQSIYIDAHNSLTRYIIEKKCLFSIKILIVN